MDETKKGRLVAKLVACLLPTAAPGFESRYLSKNTNGQHKQRSGQHTPARQNKYTKNIYPNWASRPGSTRTCSQSLACWSGNCRRTRIAAAAAATGRLCGKCGPAMRRTRPTFRPLRRRSGLCTGSPGGKSRSGTRSDHRARLVLSSLKPDTDSHLCDHDPDPKPGVKTALNFFLKGEQKHLSEGVWWHFFLSQQEVKFFNSLH